MIMPQTPPYARYYDKTGKDFIHPQGWHTCYPTVPVFDFLEGQPWDNNALSIVSMLRPTCIRVSTGDLSLDHRYGRVTVIVTNEQIITSIEYEGMADSDCVHGEELEKRVGL